MKTKKEYLDQFREQLRTALIASNYDEGSEPVENILTSFMNEDTDKYDSDDLNEIMDELLEEKRGEEK